MKVLTQMKLKTRLIVYFIGFWVVGSLVLGICFYKLLSNQIDRATQSRLMELVGHASMVINPDDHAKLLTVEDENNDIYKKSVKDLRTFRNLSTDIAFVYTARLVDNKVIFVLDAEENSEKMSHLGDIYNEAPDLLISLTRECKTPIVDKDFYTDKWGTFLSGYAPIRTSSGKLDGIVGVDISLQSVMQSRQHVLLWIIAISFALLFVALIIAFQFAKSIAAPIVSINTELNRFSTGDLQKGNSNEFAGNQDEIGSLFRAKEALQGSFSTFLQGVNTAANTV